MPSRNVIKQDMPDAYYHVYARGISKKEIFLEDTDYTFFLSLFERYLSLTARSSRLSNYSHLRGDIELLCYCLMPNHFHLVVYQKNMGAMTQLMRGVMTSYSRYFNHKYERTGPLFESRYKASCIDNDEYLMHISRYIHLNPQLYMHYRYSSLGAYLDHTPPEWLQPEKMLSLFVSTAQYKDFVSDYEANEAFMDQAKHELDT